MIPNDNKIQRSGIDTLRMRLYLEPWHQKANPGDDLKLHNYSLSH